MAAYSLAVQNSRSSRNHDKTQTTVILSLAVQNSRSSRNEVARGDG